MEQSKSLYALYRQEYDNASVYEDHKGFCVYKIEHVDGNKVLYIEESYVHPDYRGEHYSARMIEKCLKIAHIQHPCIETVITSTSTMNNNSDRAVKNILKYGFEFLKIHEDLIFFKKSIKPHKES